MSQLNVYMQEVLNSHKRSHINDKLTALNKQREKIVQALKDEFGSDMYAVINSGSYKKATDINARFDLDVIVPFKKSRFSTLAEMYEAVYECLKRYTEKIGASAPRRQRVSLGLVIQDAGHKLEIDVTPGREFDQGRYQEDGSLNLYVSTSPISQLKSNLGKQVDYIKNAATDKQSIRPVIRLLKVWKHTRGVGLKSFLVELLVIRAFNDRNIQGSLWDKTRDVLKYIADNLETVSLKDPGNSNNMVTDSLSADEKKSIVNAINALLRQVEKDESNLALYFPLNETYTTRRKANFFPALATGSSLSTQSYG